MSSWQQNIEAGNMIYKQLSEDMRDGLKNIYQQISTASSESDEQAKPTAALFTEASAQLGEVVKDTESAAMNIMEIVEKQFELATESTTLLASLRKKLGDDEDLARLSIINSQLGQDLTSVLTALSFQDITGQRIRKVVNALNAIESSVVELYLSSGLVMEAAEKDPDKDAKELQAEAKKAVEDFRDNRKHHSELKGPDKNGVSQKAIDDMLAQLGL